MNRFLHIVFAILLFPTICLSQSIQGKVVRIADGDTITILDSTNTQTRIRLHGIDCPEIGQDFGQAAKKHVADIIAGKIVNVGVTDIDRYGRSIGVVWTLDSLNVNLDLLKSGLAWHYKQFDKSEDGYRSIWRRYDGTLQAARGQARLPSLQIIHELMALASKDGWLGKI